MTEIMENVATRPGTEKLLETPKLALDRLPVLTNILERLVATCAERFREYCTIPCSFFVNQLEAGNSWDVLESYEDSIAAIYYARAWDAQVLVGLDRRFIFSLIDAAYGGDGSTQPFETDRPFTPLEIRLARSVFNIVTPSFEELLQPITPVTFDLEKVESKLDFQILGPSEIPVVVVQVLFQVLDNGGRMFMIIPQSALYPIRKRLERGRSFESTNLDPDWARKMQDGLVTASVSLEGVLDGPDLTLDDVAELREGQIIRLNADTNSLVAMECENEKVFWCKLAQSKGHFALVIDSAVDRQKEFVSELILGNQVPLK
jgi:flagellar motor switch protein FliM